nr:MAG TPA_asm: hypothetical protein [Caudoviricetes sp.]
MYLRPVVLSSHQAPSRCIVAHQPSSPQGSLSATVFKNIYRFFHPVVRTNALIDHKKEQKFPNSC